jgi:hypothetical protein
MTTVDVAALSGSPSELMPSTVSAAITSPGMRLVLGLAAGPAQRPQPDRHHACCGHADAGGRRGRTASCYSGHQQRPLARRNGCPAADRVADSWCVAGKTPPATSAGRCFEGLLSSDYNVSAAAPQDHNPASMNIRRLAPGRSATLSLGAPRRLGGAWRCSTVMGVLESLLLAAGPRHFAARYGRRTPMSLRQTPAQILDQVLQHRRQPTNVPARLDPHRPMPDLPAAGRPPASRCAARSAADVDLASSKVPGNRGVERVGSRIASGTSRGRSSRSRPSHNRRAFAACLSKRAARPSSSANRSASRNA